jgi:hypothetical protein
MRIVILTNDNLFSFAVLKEFFLARHKDIKLVVFSSALIGKKGVLASIKWSLANTGLRHTVFKLMVYGTFRLMNLICKLLPFVQNHYSSRIAGTTWHKRPEFCKPAFCTGCFGSALYGCSREQSDS